VAASLPWLPRALGAAVFAALTAILAKAGVSGLDPDLATLVRTLVVAAALALLLALTGKLAGLGGVPRRSLVFLVLSGLATGASWLCYFRALARGPASAVAPIDKLSVVFVAVLAALFLGERLPLQGWAGVALIGLGAVLVARA
jgi:transporter family protein